jgi:hypothetical protein
MTLAAILLISFFIGSPGAGPSFGPPPGLGDSVAQDQPSGQNSSELSPSQQPTQGTNPKPAPAAPQSQTTGSSTSPKPAPKKKARHKKASVPDCSDSAAPLDAGPGQPSDGSSANKAAATNGGTADAHSAHTNSGNTSEGKPCPPAKKVVTNGSTEEPTIELTHNTSEQQASQQRFTTEQLRTATEENLKKIEGRQLNASQTEMVSQIKQFMDQSKSAVAGGDLERGRSLAMKAQLLSEELIKP